jgi:PucR C-terminal helix-turn-helix domain/GGDEF-like domain
MPPLDVKEFGLAWATKIGANTLALRIVEQLWRDRNANAELVMRATRQADPNYHRPDDPKFAEAMAHIEVHFDAFLALASGRTLELGDDPLAFVRLHGVRRARQQFPLTSLLQAYRAGHKGFWAAICDQIHRLPHHGGDALATAMLLSDFAIAYSDLISVVLTEAYLDEEKQLSAQRMRLSIAVLDDLLHGHAARSGPGLDLCERARLRDGACMVALVARADQDRGGGNGLSPEGIATRQAIETALPPAEFGRLVDIRGDEVVAIVSSAAEAGRQAAQRLRAQPVAGAAATGGLRIGIGLDVREIAQLPQSYAEAGRALKLFDRAQPVAHLAEIDIGHYVSRTADTTARRLVPRSIECLIEDDREGDLARTVQEFAAASLNVKLCAKRLNVHVNTIYHRLNRVRRVTGIDPRTYSGVLSLTTALSIAGRDQPKRR